MREDIQGILSKGKIESHHTQKVWTNVPFRVSAHTRQSRRKRRRGLIGKKGVTLSVEPHWLRQEAKSEQ